MTRSIIQYSRNMGASFHLAPMESDSIGRQFEILEAQGGPFAPQEGRYSIRRPVTTLKGY